MIKISKYQNTDSTNSCLAFCFFRPVSYQKPLENLFIFLNDLKKTNIPVFSIELLYGRQQSIVPNVTKIVRSNTVVFSKENLWNLLEKYIPEQYSKIIFVDADIRFTNPNWFNLASDVLQSYNVIQPMEYCYRSVHGSATYYNLSDRIRPSIAKGLHLEETIDIGLHYPGFSIGIDRNFFNKINGIFDLGFNGCGDTLFWGAFDPQGQKYLSDIASKFIEYENYKKNVYRHTYNRKDIVSYVQNNMALHLYHGSDINRNYRKRNQYLPENYKTFYNNDGVLEIESFDNAKKDLYQYWIDRKEDE